MTRSDHLPVNLGDLLRRVGPQGRCVLIDLRSRVAPLEFSASDFDARVRAFARGLKRHGVKPGQSVGFLSGNRWEMLAGYLGSMYMGAVAVPINHKFPAKTIDHIAADADVRFIFFDEERGGLLPEGIPALGFDAQGSAGFDAFLEYGPMPPHVPGQSEIAEILYTSGSTGMPKGVPLSHHGQIWALSNYLEPQQADDASRCSLLVAPLYHMNALFFSGVCLLNTVTIVLQPQFDATRYIDAVAHYRCTHLSGVPSMFAMVAALNAQTLPSGLDCVKQVSIGSAPLSEALADRIGKIFPAAILSNGYGSTEAGPAIFGPHPEGKPRPRLSVGYPFDGVKWRLIGGTSDSEGELELKTAALTRGYLNRPDANRARFVDGWFKTNDIMYRDKNGFMFFNSRVDDMFVCGGENIYPGEVETLLNRHPSVQESLVVGAPDDIKGMVPVAFIVPLPDTLLLEEDIKSYCLENGPAYAHPRAVVFKQKLPIGGTLKIDRRSLQREAEGLMLAAGRATAGEIIGSKHNA